MGNVKVSIKLKKFLIELKGTLKLFSLRGNHFVLNFIGHDKN